MATGIWSVRKSFANHNRGQGEDEYLFSEYMNGYSGELARRE